jgi:hypothetical protein
MICFFLSLVQRMNRVMSQFWSLRLRSVRCSCGEGVVIWHRRCRLSPRPRWHDWKGIEDEHALQATPGSISQAACGFGVRGRNKRPSFGENSTCALSRWTH